MPRVTLASGVTLECADQGDPAGPAVVLLPGPTDSWRSYQPCLDLMPADIRAVSVSPRGHGASDKPATGYGVAAFAGDVVSLLDCLDIERAVVAGHSGSCLVARRVALDHPDRVAGLILEASPATLRDDPLLLHFVESVVSQLADPIDRDFARSFLTATSSDVLPSGLLDLLVEELVTVPARVWKELFTALLRYDDTTELQLIDAPALLVWGDRDTIVSRDAQDSLVRALPDARLLVYHGAGHTPRWDDAVRFGNDVVRFVRLVHERGRCRMGGLEEDALISEQIEYYRRRAPDYDATSSPPDDPLAPYAREIAAALARFRPAGRVLEIASGTGLWTALLLRHADSITALDAAEEMHLLSRARIGDDPRVRRVTADVFTWDPDGLYDVVFFANWLSHVPPGRFPRFWETVRAALAPRGRVFVTDEIEDAWRNEELLREEFVVGPSVPVVSRSLPDGRTFRVVKQFWRPAQLRAALRGLGWEAEIHPVGPFFWAAASPESAAG